MPKYRLNTFNSGSEVNQFFKKLGANDFPDWFNKNIAGRQNWGGKRIQNPSNWFKVWSHANLLFNKDTFNLVEFLCLNSIMINETGGTFVPLSEGLGAKGHPGISYAFDKIPGLKRSYNDPADGVANKSAYDLFRDSKFKNAHVTKPFGSLLKDTSVASWKGTVFPQGFSGNVNNETNASGKTNAFIFEADFVKFRGRGYIQTTGRDAYKELVKYVISYSGSNSVINSVKSQWSSYGSDLDSILTISTNQQWDDLFKNTDSIIGNYAVWVHSNKGGKYSWIDAKQSDSNLRSDIVKMGKRISGGEAYAELFYGRVMQQLNLIESTEAGSVTTSAGPTQYPETEQNQGREERTGEDPNRNVGSVNNNTDGKVLTMENKFPATIKPTPIKMDIPPEKDQQQEIAQNLGNFPFVWYNAYQIETNNISFFQLFISEGIPTVKISFTDTLGLMKDKGFPLDDSKIEIFLNPRSQQLKEILLEFKIIKFSVNGGVYNLTGILDVNGLYTKRFVSIPKMTSFMALQKISKDIGLGFTTNIDNTDDEMTWLNTGQREIDFINTIVEASYKSDETFLLYYIDYYYNLCYVDLEKELNRNIKEELGVANIGIEEVAKLDNQEKVSRLFLTNDYSMKNSNTFFEEYKVINNSTQVSIQEGYLTKVKFYDELSKDFLIFDVDSITSQGDKSIIMKGAPQDENFFKDNTQLVYTGKLDSDNMHRNYHYSYVQNNRNITELQKIAIEIVMGVPNYTLYKFQKIFVFISNQAPTPASPQINNRLTGEWFIIDIQYKFDGQKFDQVIRLVRRELDLSPEELASEPQQSKKTPTGENTSNDNTTSESTNEVVGTSVAPSTGLTSSVPVDDSNFPLTKEIFRLIYKGKVNQKVIELYYEPMKDAMLKYGINTKERISAFLAQVNAETGYLFYVTETASGNEYEGRDDLGNDQPGDGRKFKGRGLVQMTGRNNYNKTGKFLNKDFVNNPQSVASENETHQKGASTSEQITNSILTSVRFWLKGSAWGNLNDYADSMDIKKSMYFGSLSINQLPKSNAEGKQYGHKKNKNIATQYNPSDANFTNFTLICFGVNGGYNGFRDRVENWIRIREFFK